MHISHCKREDRLNTDMTRINFRIKDRVNDHSQLLSRFPHMNSGVSFLLPRFQSPSNYMDVGPDVLSCD